MDLRTANSHLLDESRAPADAQEELRRQHADAEFLERDPRGGVTRLEARLIMLAMAACVALAIWVASTTDLTSALHSLAVHIARTSE
ncbi:MAG: hypothetical protein JWL75_752 [Parcubacteria group bacterium]|nr:hypothetical protein [Parcubacteria group bacterium]